MRTVWCAEGLLEPTAGLVSYFERWPATAADPVRLMTGVRRAALPEAVVRSPHVHVASVLPGRGLRGLAVDHVRGGYWQVCRWIEQGVLPVDAVVVAGTAAGNGFDLGFINGYLQLLIDRAAVVVVEEWEDLPVTQGAARTRRHDMVAPAPASAPRIPLSGEPDEASRQIAHHACAALGSHVRTLALGVGRVADAIAEIIEPPRQLSVVTGAVADSTATLARRGVLSPDAPIHAMSVVGTANTVSWATSDPRVLLHPSTTIHSPRWLAGHKGLTVVLGGLQVDTQGNVNAEIAGNRQVSGLGGAPDFAAGAYAAPQGRVVIAMSAASPTGQSNMVDRLPATTVPGLLVDAIATEKGFAVRAGSASQWESDLRQIFT